MNENIIYNPKRRLLTVLMLIAFLFVAVLFKLFYVQIIQGRDLQAKASEQWMRDLPLAAVRGKVKDVNGVVLADTSTVYTAYVRPNAVTDAAAVASALSKYAGCDYDTLLAKIKKKGVSEITAAKGLSKSVMMSVASLNLNGIYFSAANERYYTYGDFMTQLLGFTNTDGDGQSGIEAYYNNYLKGIDGKLLTESDLVGRELESNTQAYLPSIAGLDVYTTIDYNIQQLAETAVRTAMQNHNAKGVSCVVVNPTTGAVLAMAQTPSFDLNSVPRDDLASLFAYSKNTSVSSVFEPGSTFKILTAAVALEEDVFADNKTFYCAGYRMIDGQKIKCWRSKGHGTQTFLEGVLHSCNCVFMDCALAIGTDNFYRYLEAFGLDEKTGIDAKGEASGLLLNQENVKNVDLARIGFGQAIAVTPIELAMATAAVINGGQLLKPYLLDSVRTSDGKIVVQNGKTVKNNVISASTSAEMRYILEQVVEQGSGKASYVSGYAVGGKTGTAQKYENGQIARGKYISSFVGYTMGAEALVLFMVDEPQGVYYGSMVAAPYVGNIFKGIFDYRNIAPVYTGKEAEIIGAYFALADYRGMSVSQATAALEKLGLNVEVDGDGGTVTGQLPAAQTQVNKTNTVLLYTG